MFSFTYSLPHRRSYHLQFIIHNRCKVDFYY